MKLDIRIKQASKVNGEYSLYISCPYDARVVETIRQFPDKWWHAEDKLWELPVKNLGKLVNNLQWCEFEISGQYVSMEKPKAVIPDGFEFKTTPFQHQVEGFEYGLQYDRWLLGDEQGLGKTKQVIDIAVAKKLQKGYSHCLIICGVNGLKWNWLNEIHTHSNEEGHILGQRYSRGKLSIGSTKDKLHDLQNIGDIPAYFVITNVESLRDKDIQDEVAKLCKSGDIGVVAIDEIHKCKNPQSQQGKGILKVQSEVRIAMTGTPLMNTPLDTYIILKWLGYENHSFYSFKNHLCMMGGFGGYEIVGYKPESMKELQEQLNEVMLRRRKEDVLDLPEKTYINEYVEMTAKQRLIYNEVTEEVRSNIDQLAVSPNPLAQLIRLRQATGYTGILSSEIQESAKLDRMEELVEEVIDNGKQVVIFSNWTQMTDVVFERLVRKYPLSVITGETKDELRQQNVEKFQLGQSKIMIGTIGAMGTGLTLTAGTVEIFMDEPWNKALKDQAEDRCHRVGTKENVTIYTLLCKDSIDERINDIVERKGMMADALIDGNINMNKAELLSYLIG